MGPRAGLDSKYCTCYKTSLLDDQTEKDKRGWSWSIKSSVKSMKGKVYLIDLNIGGIRSLTLRAGIFFNILAHSVFKM